MAARKSLEGPEDLVGHLAGTKTLDLGSWIYKDIYICRCSFCNSIDYARIVLI